MALIRSDADMLLRTRLGPYLDLAALGTDSFVDALGYAIRALGYPVASMVAVTDTDLAQTAEVDAVLDLSELRLMETILTNYDSVSIRAGSVDEKLGEIADRLMKLIPVKRANIAAQYGHLLVNPITGTDQRTRRVSAFNVVG